MFTIVTPYVGERRMDMRHDEKYKPGRSWRDFTIDLKI